MPLPVIFSGSCRSFLASSLFLSNNAESRLWHRGCSSGGGCKASCFSNSAADSLWLGFLSRAASSNSLMEVLQSSAISSKGGACLCIYCSAKRPWKQLFQKQWKRKSQISTSGLGIPQLGLITSLSRVDQQEQNMQLHKIHFEKNQIL